MPGRSVDVIREVGRVDVTFAIQSLSGVSEDED